MSTTFNIPKATQVAAFFLKASGVTTMKYIQLLKLMYLLDRESYRDRRRPVLCDRPVAMRLGPVLSGVYDLINNNFPGEHDWRRAFNTEGNFVVLKELPEFDRLAGWEIRKIHEIVAEYGDINPWKLIEQLHETLPEWQAHKPTQFTKQSIPIPVKDILVQVGHADDAEAIIEEWNSRAALAELLGEC